MITTRRTFLGLAAAAVTIPIAGCAPGGSAPVESTAPSDVNTDPGSLPEATITTLDTWTDKASMQAQWVTVVNAAFTAKYPKLKVNRTSATFDDINKTLKLKLSDASTPDVVPANNGWQGIGTFAKAGLILNLDAYAKGYGWDKRIPATIAKMHQVAADGSQIGTGSWFGAPIAQGGFITVYYNRAKLEKLGASVPTTFDEFKQSLSAAKSEYLPKNFAGTSGADSGQAFVDGTGLFYFYYSDSLPFRDTETANKFGTFLLPTEGRPLQATGASNQNFSVAAKSKSPDAAAAYLDFVSSEEAGDIALKTGVMPFNGPFEAPADAGALLKDEVGELNAVQETDGFVPYFDWASPTMLDTMGAQTQLLLAGRATPDELVAACQKDYDAFRKTQGK